MLTYPDIIRSGYTQGGQVGPVAVAAEIKDESQGKMQGTINAEVTQSILQSVQLAQEAYELACAAL